MSTGDYTMAVNTVGLYQLRQFMREATRDSIKRTGTIYARAMAASTPPHRGEDSSVLDKKNSPGILRLKANIARNIAGVRDVRAIKPTAQPVPFRKLAGAWLALDPVTRRPAKPRNPFGFLVPTSWRKVRGQAVPETDPAAVYSTARWHGFQRRPATYQKRFVRKNKLQALVKRQQSHVGKLISGWVPGARVFSECKKVAVGMFAEQGGKGYGKIYDDKKGSAKGVLANKQAYNSKLSSRMEKAVPGVIQRTRAARAKQVQHIIDWYIKRAQKAIGK